MTAIFELVARDIERRTDLDKLEARGTVRLALKQAGLDAGTVTAEQMTTVLERLMPGELRSRGVENPDRVCEGVVMALKEVGRAPERAQAESPEEIFRRLAGS